MSLITRPNSPYLYAEFEIEGRRVCRSTREKTERKARQVEDRLRAELTLAIGQSKTGESTGNLTQITLGDASTRFWEEKCQHEADPDTPLHELNLLVGFFGEDKLVSTIGTNELVQFREWRRSTPTRRGKLPASRTINSTLEIFRRLTRHAAEVWSDDRVKIALGSERKWKLILLPKTKGRTRELKGDEEVRLFAKLAPDYHDVIAFALLSGLRRGQLLIEWSQLDLANGLLRYERKSKHENDIGVLPLTARMIALIERQRGHSDRFVFTYVSTQNRDYRVRGVHHKRIKNGRYPITFEGLGSAMKRAVAAAGLENWRMIHDLRHTGASRTLRSSKDLMAVKTMLGHADIASTMIYVHALVDDVRDAMETVNPITFPTVKTREATAEDFGIVSHWFD